MSSPVAGFFGKLPCAGDFIQRRLPAGFVDAWDRHFEGAVAESRAELGSDWHDAYHASPVWRFLLASGVCGDAAWLGIMGPGVDRVGRCFPMVIAAPLASGSVSAAQSLSQASDWFDAAEQVHAAAQADPRISVEVFDEQVAALGDPLARSSLQGTTSLADVDWGSATHWQLPLPGVSSTGPFLRELWERLSATSGRWCVWWTAGSHRVPACVLATNGLPAASAYASFLDAHHGLTPWRSPLPFERSAPAQPVVPVGAGGLLDDLLSSPPAAMAPASPVAVAAMPSAPASPWLPDDPGLLSDLLPMVETSMTTQSVSPVVPSDPIAPLAPVMGNADAGGVANSAVISRQDCGLTAVSVAVGAADPRQRAVGEVAQIIRTIGCSDPMGSMQALRRQLFTLNAPLRQSGEDLIDPVLEDCAVVAAHVVDGQASLLRIGTAGAWHYRSGRMQSLFAQRDEPLPGGPSGDGFDDLLFNSAAPHAPGLGAAEQPDYSEVRCEAAAGDRLLLLASESLLQLPSDVLASSLALPSVDEARQRLANAAGLGMDAARWPLTIIEIGA